MQIRSGESPPRRAGVRAALFVVAAVTGALALASPARAQSVNCTAAGQTTTCRVDQPDVLHPQTDVSAVAFAAGDTVTLSADGCVQTGGSGSTWKRYVNPQSDNGLYHGRVGIHALSGSDPLPLQNFANVNGRSFVVSTASILRLGYQDDGYGDNGYYSHDDGTNGQCSGNGSWGYGGPAFVMVTIRHPAPVPPPTGCPGGLPWDTIAQGFGPLGEEVNPEWNWQCANPSGSLRDPTGDCNAFRFTIPHVPNSGLALGSGCTHELTSYDYASRGTGPLGMFPNPYWFACNWPDFVAGLQEITLSGHANFGLASYDGTIFWGDHKDLLHGGDDDYTLHLDTRPVQSSALQFGAARTPPGATAQGEAVTQGSTVVAPTTLNAEFDSSETVDLISHGWWSRFHTDVDAGGNAAWNDVSGHDAVVFGLLGLDVRHGAPPEVHPVYAIAIREAAPGHVDPNDDVWAIFARNSGTEGGCSQNDYLLNAPTVSLVLPPPAGSTAPTELPTTQFSTAIPVFGSSTAQFAHRVSNDGGKALVTFSLPTAGSHAIQYGELHLRWLTFKGPRAARREAAVQPTTESQPVTAAGQPEPEETMAGVFARLTPAQQAVVAKMETPTGAAPPAAAVRAAVAPVAAAVQTSGPTVQPVKDGLSDARLQQDDDEAAALCAATRGHPAAPLSKLCLGVSPRAYAIPKFSVSAGEPLTPRIGGRGHLVGTLGYVAAPGGRLSTFTRGYVVYPAAGALPAGDFSVDVTLRSSPGGTVAASTGTGAGRTAWALRVVAGHVVASVAPASGRAVTLRGRTSVGYTPPTAAATDEATPRTQGLPFHRVLVERRGGILSVYVDGRLDARGAVGEGAVARGARLAVGEGFGGLIQRLRIYAVAVPRR